MLFDPTGEVSLGIFDLEATPTPFGRSFLIGRDLSLLRPSHAYDPQGVIDEIDALLAATLGGTVAGLDVEWVACRDSDSGQSDLVRSSDRAWFCDLASVAGGPVRQTVSGLASDVAPVAGTVTGMELSGLTCDNLTTGEHTEASPTGTSWDCEAEGLAVAAGDRVRVRVEGARG